MLLGFVIVVAFVAKTQATSRLTAPSISALVATSLGASLFRDQRSHVQSANAAALIAFGTK